MTEVPEMKHPFTYIASLACAAGLAFGLAGIAPAQAASPANAMNNARVALVPLVSQSTVTAQVEQVQYRYRHRGHRHRWREPRRHHRRHFRGGPGFYFHFGPAPRHYAPPRRAHRLPAAHIRWCQNRYRSYRASDNTFQPYRGPRRACRSPYY
jgi:hypothetical protein